MSTPIKTKGILISGYNNYFNRLLKRKETVAEYLALPNAHLVGTEATGGLFNFNMNDGVDTTHVFSFDWEGSAPDYFVLLRSNAQGVDEIDSRWFVTEAIHLSGQKKYRVTLHRDVLADYYDAIMDSPCYIEKGHVGISNPFILNSENLPLNQIKKSEVLLKDQTGIGWYYIYLAKNLNAAEHPITIDVGAPTQYETIPNDFAFFTTTPHTYEFIGTDNQDFAAIASLNVGENLPKLTKIDLDTKRVYSGGQLATTEAVGITIGSLEGNARFIEGIEIAMEDVANLRTMIATDLNVNDRSKYNQLISLQNKVVKYNNKYYTCRVTLKGQNRETGKLSVGSTFGVTIDDELSKPEYSSIFYYYQPNNNTFRYDVHTLEVEVVFELRTEYQKTVTLSNNRQRTNATYDVLVLPADRTNIVVDGVQKSSINSIDIVNAIATTLSGFVYDIQLLPYFPYQNKILSAYYLEFDTTEDGNIIQTVDIDGTNAIYLFYLQEPTIKNIAISHSITVPDDEVEFKLDNECDVYRLVSPNFNGQFDFSVTKNQGVDGFRADMLVQPNVPYIYVRPNFKGLYGGEYLDNRGLICSGDFSLPRVDDKFIDYQLQNKNYQNIFDRQIQNMEVHRKYQRIEQAFTLAAGAGQGAAMGGMYGGKGAAIGGGLGVAGGIADFAISEAMYKENKDFAIDNFNMSLENIQALPYSVTKINPLTPSNKIFPFIEYYSCTEDEREALRKKIIYDGMTIGAIGTLRDYIGTGFTKGQMIRLETVSEDTHLLNIIYNEVMKGVVL